MKPWPSGQGSWVHSISCEVLLFLRDRCSLLVRFWSPFNNLTFPGPVFQSISPVRVFEWLVNSLFRKDQMYIVKHFDHFLTFRLWKVLSSINYLSLRSSDDNKFNRISNFSLQVLHKYSLLKISITTSQQLDFYFL